MVTQPMKKTHSIRPSNMAISPVGLGLGRVCVCVCGGGGRGGLVHTKMQLKMILTTYPIININATQIHTFKYLPESLTIKKLKIIAIISQCPPPRFASNEEPSFRASRASFSIPSLRSAAAWR